jgi:hypothetical protein
MKQLSREQLEALAQPGKETRSIFRILMPKPLSSRSRAKKLWWI